MTDREIEELAERAADRAVDRVFETLGIDLSSIQERRKLRDNLTWVGEFRAGALSANKVAWGTAITAVIGGGLWLLWEGAKVALRLKAA